MNQKITISADFLANIKGMDQVVSTMKKGLEQANFDFNKGANFTKLFNQYENEYNKFISSISSGEVDILDSKSVMKNGEKVITLFKQIEQQFNGLSNIDVNLAKKLFPSNFSENLKGAKNAITEFENATKTINQKQIKLDESNEELEGLKQQLDDAKKAISDANEKLKSFGDNVNTESLEKQVSDVADKVKTLKENLAGQLSFNLKDSEKDNTQFISNAEIKILALKNSWEEAKRAKESYEKSKGVKSVDDLVKQQKQLEANIERRRELNALIKSSDTTEEQKNVARTELSKMPVIDDFNKQITEIKVSIKEYQKILDNFNEQKTQIEKATGAEDNIKALKEQSKIYDEVSKKQKEYSNTVKELNTAEETAQPIQIKYDNIIKNMQAVEEEINKLKAGEGNVQNLYNALRKLGMDIDLNATADDLEQVKDSVNNIETKNVNNIKQELNGASQAAAAFGANSDKASEGLHGIGEQAKEINRVNSEMEDLKNKLTYFFGLGNAIKLTRNAIRNAYDTVKELDATMTETAVVTDFSVSDMWEQLPEYTKRANELGVATNEAYKAATLYYQQGS